MQARLKEKVEVGTLGTWGSKLADEAAQSHFWVCHGVSTGQELQILGPNCLVRNQKDLRDHSYWASYLTVLCLGFLICKVGMVIIEPTSVLLLGLCVNRGNRALLFSESHHL